MALCGRLARRTTSLAGQARSVAAPISSRAFTQRVARPVAALRSVYESPATHRQLRAFSSLPANWQEQKAPSAEAYINSGAVGGAKNLVDVKKVLVIGSGGLSIGQAGEFDYSGMGLNKLPRR